MPTRNRTGLVSLLLLLVQLELPAFAQPPVDFGSGFDVEWIKDSAWEYCELKIEVIGQATGTASLSCRPGILLDNPFDVRRELAPETIAGLRQALRKAQLFEGRFWGQDWRSADYALITLKVADGFRVATLIVSLNESFQEGPRRQLVELIDELSQAMRPPEPDRQARQDLTGPLAPVGGCALAICSTQDATLQRVMSELRTSRMMTARSTCPTCLSALSGISREHVSSALGPPDFCEAPRGKPCDSSRSWTYFFVDTSRLPPGQMGGGFPQLTFSFDADSRVEDAECHYAR